MLKMCMIKFLENYYSKLYSYQNNEINYDEEFKKIALILTSPLGLGDLIMMTPVIKSFKKNFPSSEIHLITNHDILGKEEACIDKIIIVKGSILSLIKEFSKLRKNNYDLGVILARAVNQSIYLNKLRPRFKLGFLGGYKILSNFKLKHNNLYFDKNEHFTLNSLKILKSIDKTNYNYTLSKCCCSKEISKKNKELLKKLELDKSKKTIFVNTYALWETRKWDENNYIKLIEKLYKKFNFVLYGGTDSIEINKYIENKLKEKNLLIKNISGKLNLKESICIIKYADLFITSDTGPMHFAFMSRTPVLALFGPVKPNQRMPIDKRENKINHFLWVGDYQEIKMYNYEKKHKNKKMEKLTAIPVEDVEKIILKLFK